MLLKQRKELEELKRIAGRSTEQLSNERLAELEKELELDKKESRYVAETLTEESTENLTWTEKLAWMVTGIQADLADVELQMSLTSLKGTPAEKQLKDLREKKLEIEERKFKKQEHMVKVQEASGILPPGSLKNLQDMRDRAAEYGLHPDSLQKETKFSKLTLPQLSQKKEYLEFRARERASELEELEKTTMARQKEKAESVLQRIAPKEYVT